MCLNNVLQIYNNICLSSFVLVYGTLPKPEIAQSDEQGQLPALKLALECIVHTTLHTLFGE